MDILRTPMTDDRVKAAESVLIAELKSLVEAYKKTDGDEGQEAFDRIVEVTANAYRRAADWQMLRVNVSSAVHNVLREVLGDTYDDERMLGMERQLYRLVAELGTGFCGEETVEKMTARHGTELAECILSAEPEMAAFRAELNKLTPVGPEDALNVDFWAPFANLACDMFDARTEGGRYTPTLAPIIWYEMQRVSAPQEAINAFMAHVKANEERLEALSRMHRALGLGSEKAVVGQGAGDTGGEA